MKVMKMLLLTVSLMLLYGCQHTVEDFIRIDDYKFCSLTELGKEIKKPNDVDVIANIRDSKRIKGPLTSSSCHPKFFVKEFCYFLMSCHQHCLGINLLVQR